MCFPSFNLAAVLCCVLFMAVCCPSPKIEARPQYLKLFISGYPKVANAASSKKCAICHEEDKEKRLPYGKAVESGIGSKDEKNDLKIVTALHQAEKGTGKNGQTFGQMLKNGKLPE